jgi:hypothetical protein
MFVVSDICCELSRQLTNDVDSIGLLQVAAKSWQLSSPNGRVVYDVLQFNIGLLATMDTKHER